MLSIKSTSVNVKDVHSSLRQFREFLALFDGYSETGAIFDLGARE